MNNTNYSQKVIDHFTHPRNVGEIKNPDGVGEVGNPMCGDTMRLTIRVDPSSLDSSHKATNHKKASKGKQTNDGQIKEIISDIKFKTFGCAAAIATSSVLTELAKGKNINDAEKITRQDIADELGGLPAIKMHCSNLAADALREAIKDYRTKNNK